MRALSTPPSSTRDVQLRWSGIDTLCCGHGYIAGDGMARHAHRTIQSVCQQNPNLFAYGEDLELSAGQMPGRKACHGAQNVGDMAHRAIQPSGLPGTALEVEFASDRQKGLHSAFRG